MKTVRVSVYTSSTKGKKGFYCDLISYKGNEARWRCSHCNKGVIKGLSVKKCPSCDYHVSYFFQLDGDISGDI